MFKVLHGLGARCCRVAFYGMKCGVSMMQPIVDRYIERYEVQMRGYVPEGAINIFDYGMLLHTQGLTLYRMTEQQKTSRNCIQNRLFPMCSDRDYGSITFEPAADMIKEYKIYPEVCHEILSHVSRRLLDDMPLNNAGIRNRYNALLGVHGAWQRLNHRALSRRLSGVRLEATIQTRTIAMGLELCNDTDLLSFDLVEDMLGGPFETKTIEAREFMQEFTQRVIKLGTNLHGQLKKSPKAGVRHTLTFARNAMGWSDRNMRKQLQLARIWERRQNVWLKYVKGEGGRITYMMTKKSTVWSNNSLYMIFLLMLRGSITRG